MLVRTRTMRQGFLSRDSGVVRKPPSKWGEWALLLLAVVLAAFVLVYPAIRWISGLFAR
jgi:hypothetical protein